MKKLILWIFAIFFLILQSNYSCYAVSNTSYVSLAMLGTDSGNPYNPADHISTTPSAINQDDNTVSSGREFLLWMDDHKNFGGTVTLSCDISIYPRTTQEYFYPSKKITIDTAGHSITIKKGTFLNLNGSYIYNDTDKQKYNIEINGSGSEPLIILDEGGFLYLQYVKLRTAGTNSTVIHNKSDKMNMNIYGSSIEASGTNSTGIISRTSLELENTSISVTGTNSTAVKSEGSIYVFFGKLFAQGDLSKSAVTSGGAITLDTSYSCPNPTGAIIVNRTLSENNRFKNIHIQTTLNNRPENIYNEIQLNFTNINDSNDKKEMRVPIDWNMNNVDITKEGTYEATGNIIPPWEGIMIHGNPVLYMKIDVKDASIPDMSFISITNSTNKYFQVEFPCAISNSENIILWKSDNNIDWYDYTENCDFIFGEKMIVHNVEPEILTYFKLQVTGDDNIKGTSKAISIIIHNDESFDVSFVGGDRDGGDRDGGNKSENHKDNLSSQSGKYNYENTADYPGKGKVYNYTVIYNIKAMLEQYINYTADAYEYVTASNAHRETQKNHDDLNYDVKTSSENLQSLSGNKNTDKTNKINYIESVTDESDKKSCNKNEDQNNSNVSKEIENSKVSSEIEPKSDTTDNTENKYDHDYVFLIVLTGLIFSGVIIISVVSKRKNTP